MTDKEVEPCSCPIRDFKGYCPRHQIEKDNVLHSVCQNDADTRAMWDQQVAEKQDVNGNPNPPGLLRKAINFAKANAKWVSSGMQVRSEERIKEIFAICNQCEFFMNGHCAHEDCGCPVSDNGDTMRNKIVYSSEGCPDGRWLPDA